MVRSSKSLVRSKAVVSKKSSKTSEIGKLTQVKIIRFLGLWIFSFVILQSFFLQQALSANNRVEIFPAELLFPTLIYLLESLIIAATIQYLRWPKTIGSKTVSVLLISLFFIDYDTRLQSISGTMQAFVPLLPSGEGRMPIISLVFIFLLFGISVFIGRLVEFAQAKYQSLGSMNVVVSLCIVVGIVAIGPFIDATKVIPVLVRESKTQAPTLPNPAVTTITDKPDIYYIVLDRYTNNQVLGEQIGFDNSSFTEYLNQNGFHVNEGAFSNYPYTAISISSTMSAAYTNSLVEPHKNQSLQSHTLYHNLVRQSAVAKALKEKGYQYSTVGSWYGATSKNPLADKDYMSEATINIFGTQKRLRDMEYVSLRSNPLYRFIREGGFSWLPVQLAESSHPEYITQQLKTLKDIASSEEPGGRFIFAHILVPHEPFFFNADGSLNNNFTENNVGKPVSQKYTDQISFINDQMREIIDQIRTKSGDTSIILLNADEGAYPQTVTISGSQFASEQISYPENMTEWPKEGLRMKYGILQAARIPMATSEDLSHLSSVNLFRIVLNRYAGYQLPYLPNCNFALTKGSQFEFLYADISPMLQESPDPACAQLSTDASP